MINRKLVKLVRVMFGIFIINYSANILMPVGVEIPAEESGLPRYETIINND